MWALARVFVDIAIHRRGPDELPPSRFLLGVLLGLDVLVGVVALWALGDLDAGNTQRLLLVTIFLLAYVFVALRLFGHDRRFPQTAIALLGTDILITIVSWPLALWSRIASVPPDVSVAPETLSVPMLLSLLLLLWWVDVAGFVLGRAISRPYFVGVLFVIVYFVTSLSIGEFLFPSTP